MQPKYQHDCESCVFLGTTIGNGKIVDCYYHENPDGSPSLIARYSNEGSDYASMRWFNGSYAPIPMGHAELYACLGFYCAKKEIEMPKITFTQAQGYFT